MRPGASELIRMPSGASSVASVLNSALTPARKTFERIRPPIGCLIETELTPTMRPPPLARK
ncbi:hypothetical protein D3C87_2162750 [compost metagenome]